MRLALVLSALSGFIALSYEIVWVRAFSFVTQATARSFPMLLAAYLLGLALGSLWSLRHRDQADAANPRQLRTLAVFTLAANLFGYAVVPLMSWMAVVVTPWATLTLVVAAAAMLGVTFPLLCHFGVAPDARAGKGLSYLYVANILGSTAGSLLTGFVLMDVLPLRGIAAALGVAGLAMALGLAWMGGAAKSRWALGSLVGAVVLVAGAPLFYGGIWERLQLRGEWWPDAEFQHVIEGRGGVITVDEHDQVFGGGAYDGKVSYDLVGWPWIVRPYAVSAFHPAPEKVLVIGLSSGVWAQILVHHPQVESVTAVEIDSGYLELIERLPAVRSLLDNPKLTLHIDDGRRWLRRHPEARFDVVVANVTHHWRAYASNLLSVEFLERVKAHLEPGGLLIYNATDSLDAQRTALEVFPHALQLLNNMVVSNAPFDLDKARWKRVLASYRIDGEPVFDLPTDAARLDEVVSLLDTVGQDLDTKLRIQSREQIAERTRAATVITDDNMASEW